MMSPTPGQPRLERRHLAPDPDNDDIVTAIVGTVESIHHDPEPFDEPLYDIVDTEALARLLRHADGNTEPVVSFVVADCTVVVSSGTVVARPADDAVTHRDPQALLSELTTG